MFSEIPASWTFLRNTKFILAHAQQWGAFPINSYRILPVSAHSNVALVDFTIILMRFILLYDKRDCLSLARFSVCYLTFWRVIIEYKGVSHHQVRSDHSFLCDRQFQFTLTWHWSLDCMNFLFCFQFLSHTLVYPCYTLYKHIHYCLTLCNLTSVSWTFTYIISHSLLCCRL